MFLFGIICIVCGLVLAAVLWMFAGISEGTFGARQVLGPPLIGVAIAIFGLATLLRSFQ